MVWSPAVGCHGTLQFAAENITCNKDYYDDQHIMLSCMFAVVQQELTNLPMCAAGAAVAVPVLDTVLLRLTVWSRHGR